MTNTTNTDTAAGPNIQSQEISKAVQAFQERLATQTEYPIRVKNIKNATYHGCLKTAWQFKTGFHLIEIGSDVPDRFCDHVKCHELTHLELHIEANKAGTERYLVYSSEKFNAALHSLKDDYERLWEWGWSNEKINPFIQKLVRDIITKLKDIPLDMVVEHRIFNNMPILREQQFLHEQDAFSVCSEFMKDLHSHLTVPPKIWRAYCALFVAYALFLDNLFEGTSQFAAPFMHEPSFGTAQRLWKCWQDRSILFKPGDEYKLVDDFADILDLRDWYVWKEAVAPLPDSVAGSSGD